MNIEEMTENLLRVVKADSAPALGCTEPVAVAYAGSAARRYITGDIVKIEVVTSKNIFKNGKSVIVPNTGKSGLDLAATIGVLGGDFEAGFMVLQNVDEDIIKKAEAFISEKKVSVVYGEDTPDIYVKVNLETTKENIETIVIDHHTHLQEIKVDNKTVFEDSTDSNAESDTSFLENLSFKEIREISETIPLDKLDFVEAGIEMNKNAANKGLEGKSGLNIGFTLAKLYEKGYISMDSPTRARILTAAGADMRMSGGNCPIMTSGGSGNQGLGVILPITVVAEDENIERERLIRAIFFAHAINRFVKEYSGKLSGMCGCAIAAGIGASAGITWMLGGSDDQISGACTNMFSNLTGMVCDGAKETCSFKLATSAEESVIAAYLVLENIIAKDNVGIIGSNIENTIRNIGLLCRYGFKLTDKIMLDIIAG